MYLVTVVAGCFPITAHYRVFYFSFVLKYLYASPYTNCELRCEGMHTVCRTNENLPHFLSWLSKR